MDKKNFEKDINVPSKRRIMDDYNAKDCEQCSPDSVCCYCKNIACYKLEEQFKAKEQECEDWKETLNECCLHGLTLMTEKRVLLQTLAEIKEIAEKTLNMVDYKTYFKRDNKSLKQEGFKAIDQILQKISEVEE